MTQRELEEKVMKLEKQLSDVMVAIIRGNNQTVGIVRKIQDEAKK